ncbi:MAG: YHYH protein [Acidobacteriota bacterium]
MGSIIDHANPICLRGQLNDNTEVVRKARAGVVYGEKAAPWTHSPILGWAFDGFPIYGPYAYSDAGSATSAVKRMKASFRLRNIAARTSLPDWALPQHTGVPQQLSANQYGPAIGGQFPLGRYNEDFEYVAGLGDLDLYNGRFAITPEFPQGIYAYYITIDDTGAAAFPYILGGQFYGSVTGGTAQAISAAALDYFVNGALAPGAASNPALASALFSSWAVRNATQNAQVTSGFDPSAGPKATWPTNIPAGATTSGSVATPTPSDTQRVRYTDTTVYVNANGLASHVMGPWFDPLQPGGVFGNFPSVQNVQVQLPRTPATAQTKRSTALGSQGVFVNGVALFNFLDGASYSNAAGRDVGGGLANPTAIHVSAASFEAGPLAAGSLVTAFSLFNTTLATSTATADSANWPTTLGGATVTVTDSTGTARPAPIYYTSPTQINYRLPPNTAAGFGSVTISAGGAQSSGNINVAAVYPNLFLQAADGLAAAYTVTSGSDTYLVLAATGLGSTTSATATIGGVDAAVSYAGPQGFWPGLDQLNILIPRALAGRGKVDVVVTAGGKISNTAYTTVR